MSALRTLPATINRQLYHLNELDIKELTDILVRRFYQDKKKLEKDPTLVEKIDFINRIIEQVFNEPLNFADLLVFSILMILGGCMYFADFSLNPLI